MPCRALWELRPCPHCLSCRNRHCPIARVRGGRHGCPIDRPNCRRSRISTLCSPCQATAEIAFQNKAALYTILFKAAAEALTTIAADPGHLGAEIGFVAVLHTWGQNLHHHLHLHCLVPGGGLSPDGTRWVSCRPGFFLLVPVLSRLFLGQLKTAFAAGKLAFFGALAPLADGSAFARRLAELRQWSAK